MEHAVLPGRNSRDEDKDRELPLPVVRPRRKICFIADEDEDHQKIREAFQDQEFETMVRRSFCSEGGSVMTVQEVAETVRQLLLSNVVAIESAWNTLVCFPQLTSSGDDACYRTTLGI